MAENPIEKVLDGLEKVWMRNHPPISDGELRQMVRAMLADTMMRRDVVEAIAPFVESGNINGALPILMVAILDHPGFLPAMIAPHLLNARKRVLELEKTVAKLEETVIGLRAEHEPIDLAKLV